MRTNLILYVAIVSSYSKRGDVMADFDSLKMKAALEFCILFKTLQD